MILVRPSIEILDCIDGDKVLMSIERAGRTCYKSDGRTPVCPEGARRFVAMLLRRGHESVIEHEKVSVKIVCDRGVSHEIVRHRIASYSQESTRYCDYAGGRHVTFVIPPWVMIDPGEYGIVEPGMFLPVANSMDQCWFLAMANAEAFYRGLRSLGWRPEQARAVLPNSLKTEIVMTANLREWRHFFRVRTAPAAHPQMREVARELLDSFRLLIPVVFDDIPEFDPEVILA